jgi:predicted Zn-dependent peptidase
MISTENKKSVLDRTIPPDIKDAVEFNLVLKPCTTISLANGARVYYINDGAEEVANVEIIFYAGNSWETKNLVASATNYLLKNGTVNKSALDINEHFEYYGAYLNGHCYNEIASLSLHCLSKHLSSLLPVVRELITESVFPEREIEIYKQNSIQRLSVNLQKPDFVANRLIDQYLFGSDHPYGRVSTVEAIKALNRNDLADFFQRFYCNATCMIFAAGKLPAGFEDLLNSNFGDLHLNNKPVELTHKITRSSEKKFRVINDANGVQGAVRLARPFPNRHHPDYNKARVLNCLLGGFFGSRLMNNIREDKGYTYGIYSFFENYISESAWVISTEAGRDVCEATIAEVYKEMEILREVHIEADELLLVKNYLMGGTLGDLDGPFHVISRWKSLLVHGLDDKNFYDLMSKIKNITADELKDLANKYLVPEDFFELVVI